MALTKYRLGELIELCSNTNKELLYDASSVRGVNNVKQLMPTKADLNDRDLSKFQIVKPEEFVFNHRTSRNGNKFSIALNFGTKPIICTEDYVVFRIKDDCKKILLEEWLYMYFNRSEFDRYVITNSWGSSTEFYNWEDLCSITLDLPDIETQQKYVDVYKAMVANQKAYERGLDDLKLTCDAYIEDLRRKLPCEKIGKYITEISKKVKDGEKTYSVEQIMGISSIEKSFMPTKADTNGLSLSSYKIVFPNCMSFNPNTARMGDKIPVALNSSTNDYLVSAIYPVFSINEKFLLADYIMMWMKRDEFDRYARFNSWGSAREMFTFEDMQEVEIPIPDIAIQKSIVDIYSVYKKRKEINEKLKTQIKNICPILIKGSLEEGSNEVTV